MERLWKMNFRKEILCVFKLTEVGMDVFKFLTNEF